MGWKLTYIRSVVMTDPIPRALSGSGQNIFDKIHEPLLGSSTNFDRVSSFFGPKGLAKAISEIADIWKSGGKIRMMLSPADTSEIHQALENITDDDDERKISTVRDSIEIAVRKIKGTHPEVVAALEEMLINDLLQVAVVIPREGNGLFHSKFSIYHIGGDSEIGGHVDSGISKYVAVHGSFNESEAGYSKNIEDASTHRSWDSSEYEVAQVFKLRFDELWNDFAPDAISVPITDVVKDALDIPEGGATTHEVRNLTIGAYLHRISTIPSSLGFDDSIWLMPHQISVVNSAMMYSPVRSMLCDEVGLGKTIQAGAIMSRLISEKTCERALIIAPAATLTQWAFEISSKFGYPVSLYRNQCRERYLNGLLVDETRVNTGNDPNQLIDGSQVTIISSQWFRLRSRNYIEILVSNYQMMILDEAHHARLKNWKKREGTILHEKIKIVSELIPNVLLLTATPFQTGKADYLSLLDILQMVTEEDEEDLRIGAGVVSGELPWNPNQESMLIRSLARRLELVKPHVSSNLYETIRDAPKPLGLSKISKIINENIVDENLLFSTLPTTLSTFRNTRSMLREIGMGFPDVIFEAVPVESKEYEEVLKKSENFIMKYLGGRDFASGLTRSLYYQRAISSIAALHSTLSNRRDNILFDEIEKADHDLDFERMPPAADIEIERIELLLNEIEQVMDIVPDPKLRQLTKLIDKLYDEQRRTLIFSRYTATTSSIENELWNSFPDLSIGRYDGQHIRIRKAGESAPEDVTKDILIMRLMNDELDVVVCSDAASEGLNLQSASAVINVDVPWNPARVMQRIGRVDRLGQLSPSVLIYNLVYFGTIEERMYRVLDGRQTEAIRYLGEHPEMLSTEESRHMYQVFGVPIRERVDAEQSQTREDVMLERLLRESEHQDSHLSFWIRSIIEQNPELNLDVNPASKSFVMRNEVILKSNLKLSSSVRGELGYAVSEEGVRHALLVKSEQGFIPLTPSVLLNSNEETQIEWYALEDAVEMYENEFASIPLHLRSPGLMSDMFYHQNNTPEITFMSIT
jgi:superfamily II DNA or RNA helicase